MLLATLSLVLLPQQEYVGALQQLRFPPDRLAVEEANRDGFHMLSLVDPADRQAMFPPLRVLTVMDGDSLRRPGEFASEALADTRRILKEQGATIDEERVYVTHVLGETGSARELRVTVAGGEEWIFEILGLRVAGHLTVVSSCRPADAESQRSKDVLHAVATLESRGWDVEQPMHFDLLGLRFGLPLAFEAASQQNGVAAVFEANGEDSQFKVQVERKASPAAAEAAAAAVLEGLLGKEQDRTEIERSYYSKNYSGVPALYAIGPRTIIGRSAEARVGAGPRDCWRHEFVFSLGDRVCRVSAHIREDFTMRRGSQRFADLLATIDATSMPGTDSQSFEDGLHFRHDTRLERRRVETEHGVRWEFKRRGIETASFGEVWVEIRDDLEHDDGEEARALKVNAACVGQSDYSYIFRDTVQLLGQPALAVWTDVRKKESRPGMTEWTTRSCTTPFGVGKFLVAGNHGQFAEGLELRGLMEQVVAGLVSTVGAKTARFEDAGLSYDFDPSQCQVVSGERGTASTVTVRKTTITTRWAPRGGRLFGPGPSLEKALHDRIGDLVLSLSLDGETTEPTFGPAGFGEVAAQYGYFRSTDAAGAEWDYITMIADTAQNRVRVEVVGEVADTAAVEFMTAMLATLRVK